MKEWCDIICTYFSDVCLELAKGGFVHPKGVPFQFLLSRQFGSNFHVPETTNKMRNWRRRLLNILSQKTCFWQNSFLL
jgi:hypothetical protein